MNQIVFLFLILALAVGLPLFFKMYNSIEGYSNYSLDGAMGDFPKAQTEVLVQDTFPAIGKNQISNNSASDIWWEYPEFDKSSFAQITNNLRYVNSPDNGTCIRADMCGALYKKKKNKSNIVKPLPPAQEGPGARVGYYRSEPNLLAYSIPDNENILY